MPRVPEQALRWRPTWEQITPSARAGFTRPAPPANGSPMKTRRVRTDGDEPTVDSREPTVWVRADDGLVRPIPIKLGISDGMNTEVTGGDLNVKDEVVIHDIRAAKPDFVSSFVNRDDQEVALPCPSSNSSTSTRRTISATSMCPS